MRTTQPANVDTSRWSELLRSGGGTSGPSPVPAAAVALRRSAERSAGRDSTA
jgi:hypothetical protein